MDNSEKIVENYLKHINFQKIDFEPDGNIPPDFVVDAKIAIEVRRLNQNYDSGDGRGLQGLESAEKSLYNNIKTYLSSIAIKPEKNSWFFNYEFSRPIPKWKNLRAELEYELVKFIKDENKSNLHCKLNIEENFKFTLIPTSEIKEKLFILGCHNDKQSGGWVNAEIFSNLEHCIKEKSEKISAYYNKYSEWWLVLPDFIGLGIDENDQKQFHETFQIDPGKFTKIILLDPRDHKRSFQVYPQI